MHRLRSSSVVLTALVSAICSACDCNPMPSIKDALIGSDLVFLGHVAASEEVRVTQEESLSQRTMIRYMIVREQMFKGSAHDTIYMYSGEDPVMNCGFRFELGMSYIVYAHRSTMTDPAHSDASVLYTSVCTRTKERARSEIRKLRKLTV